MIAIADSGSTKTDWVILDSQFNEVFRTNTIGMNPYYVSSEDVRNEMFKNKDLSDIRKSISQVFFYGAGCSSDDLRESTRKGLTPFFNKAEIEVNHDLLAACYAVYRGKPSMVCILGTGSNSCYFDGKSLREETDSLAYILGDEGSGNDLGKRVIQAYFLKRMPTHLAKAFDEKYKLNVRELNRNVYQNQFANAYLASFSEFVHTHKSEPFIQKIIYDSMKSFMVNQIQPYEEARHAELNFIGSVAYYYEDIIRATAAEMYFKVGHIVKKPIDNLVDYHIKYVLNKLVK